MTPTFDSEEGSPLEGVLKYSAEDYSLRFELNPLRDRPARLGVSGLASIMIGTLQLEVDIESRLLLFAWGLHPKTLWIDGSGAPHDAHPGRVKVGKGVRLQEGVAIPMSRVGEWSTIYDSKSKWARLTKDFNIPDEIQVTISSGVVIGLRQKYLNSVWMYPLLE